MHHKETIETAAAASAGVGAKSGNELGVQHLPNLSPDSFFHHLFRDGSGGGRER